MKRIISFLLIAVMLLSAVPMAYAYVPGGNMCIAQHDGGEEYSSIECCAICDLCPVCDGECDCLAPVNYTSGTQVLFDAEDPDGDGVKDNVESYTVTVPAKLIPEENQNIGNVVAQGTWPSDRKLVVTADTSVRLVNSLNADDYKDLDVTFANFELLGNNTQSVSKTEPVSVELMPEDALFGIWSGVFYYNVEMTYDFDVKLGEAYVVVDARIPSQRPFGSWIIFNQDGSASGYYEAGPGTYGYTGDMIYNGDPSNIHFYCLEDGTLVDNANDPWTWYAPESQLPLQEVRIYSEDGVIDETIFVRVGTKWGRWVTSELNTCGAIIDSNTASDIIFFDGYKCQYGVSAHGYPMYVGYQTVIGNDTEYLLIREE